MALTTRLDVTKTPIELTVTSDKRKRPITGTVEVAGETANFAGELPPLEPKVTDDSGRVWTKRSDDGATAVYTG